MKNNLNFRINPEGNLESIYQDGIEQFAKKLGASIKSIRASNVEFEEAYNGWTIRSILKPNHSLRWSDFKGHFVGKDHEGELAIFNERQVALQFEELFFWDLV